MAPYLPPPDASSLLPPLLACLPTAFASSHPPPAVLPLLSPILRQRVQLLSGGGDAASSQSSWLPLLCWEPSEASELVSLVESRDFEPHPVSGEIEVEDVTPVFKRVDEETLQSAFEMPEMGLKAIYLWCEGDRPEEEPPGWRLSELRPLKGSTSDERRSWSKSITEASDRFRTSTISSSQLLAASAAQPMARSIARTPSAPRDAGEDDYWAMYDNTPSRTPAPPGGVLPEVKSSYGGLNSQVPTSEADYYAQYAGVQPAMDHDDPSADVRGVGESTLLGNELTRKNGLFQPSSEAEATAALSKEENGSTNGDIVHTRPSSSSSSSAVAHLEQTAESQSQAELAIQHHISASIKSLFRLARGAGVSRTEFERLIHTELEVLKILEEDD